MKLRLVIDADCYDFNCPMDYGSYSWEWDQVPSHIGIWQFEAWDNNFHFCRYWWIDLDAVTFHAGTRYIEYYQYNI